MMNFQTTYRQPGHRSDERRGMRGTTNASVGHGLRSAGVLVPRPTRQQQQHYHHQQQQMNSRPTCSKNSTTALPASHPASVPVDYLFPVPGGGSPTHLLHPSQWFPLLSSAPEIAAAMRIGVNVEDVAMADDAMAYSNVGAHFSGELAYLQPGVAEERPLVLAEITPSPDGASPPAGGQVPSFDVNSLTFRIESELQSDEDISWSPPSAGQRSRIGQQNAGFACQEPATIGGTASNRRRQSSSSSESRRGNALSPSDSSNSWVQLTPRTGTPQPHPRTSRESSEEDQCLEDPAPVQESRVGPVGPSRVWNVPQPKKRGRRRGTGGVAKDRKKDNGPAKARQVAKRDGPLPEDVREQARITKKLGACRRCHYKKARCPFDPKNPEGICLACKPLSPSPCFRYAITEASLYRQQKAPYPLWTKRWKSMDMVDITRWASTEVRTICVSQIFLDAPYTLRVKKFVPEEGDMMERFWFDGDAKRRMEMPAYAIANMEEAAKSIDQMMKDNTVNYFSSSIEPLKGTGHPGLIWITYEFAFRHLGPIQDKEEGKLLNDTLKLWIACRLTSYSEAIVGQETLGMALSQDPTSPYRNKIPIPPIMVAQLECIVFSRFLQPLSMSVLSQLDRIIGKKKQADWLSIYLTLFLLLHSCALLTQRDAEYARRLRLKQPFANQDAINAHHSGALTLLAHFHFVSGGMKPFRLAEERRLHEYRGNTSFTPEQEDFIRYSAMTVRMMDNDLGKARASGDPGNPLYWVSQLYDEEWTSDKMN